MSEFAPVHYWNAAANWVFPEGELWIELIRPGRGEWTNETVLRPIASSDLTANIA